MKIFICSSWRDRELVASISEMLSMVGYNVTDSHEVPISESISSWISSQIRSSDAVIAIVSKESTDVFYELGLAMGSGVPLLIAAAKPDLLPSDAASIPLVRLTGNVQRDSQTVVGRLSMIEVQTTFPEPEFVSSEEKLMAAASDPDIMESLVGEDLEQLLAEVLTSRGYSVSLPISRSSAAGYDFVINSPSTGGKILVETKKLSRQGRVSVDAVRQLLSALPVIGDAVCLLVSNTGYTAAASLLAATTGVALRTVREVLDAKSEEDLTELVSGPESA